MKSAGAAGVGARRQGVGRTGVFLDPAPDAVTLLIADGRLRFELPKTTMLPPMPEPTTTTPRERNLFEAYLHGLSVLAMLIAGTLGIVMLLLWLCGEPPSVGPSLCVVALLLGSGVLRFYARLARET